MALLKGYNINLEIGYNKLNEYGEIEYYFDFSLDNKPILNPKIFNKELRIENGFIFALNEEKDELADFFIECQRERKGSAISKVDHIDFRMELESWNEIKNKHKKDWEEQTIIVNDGDGIFKKVPYKNVVEGIFGNYLKNKISIKIEIDSKYFLEESKTSLFLTIETDWHNFDIFVSELLEEKKVFQKLKL